jgi:hypothetical protein
MNAVVESMEAVLVEAYRAKGWKFVSLEPLWLTWPMEKFGTCVLFTPVFVHCVDSMYSYHNIGHTCPLSSITQYARGTREQASKAHNSI